MPEPVTMQQLLEFVLVIEKTEGGWFRADCPIDAKHLQTLYFSENDRGALLIRCDGGCKFFYLTKALREKRDQRRICA